jgi:hypothetical protein
MQRTRKARHKEVPSEASGNRAAFLLDTFLWRSKEKYLALGCENPIQINCRVSDALNLNSTECVTSVTN